MSSDTTLSEIETILANQKTILQNQELILKGQCEIKKNQDEILAGQRHCMYRDALEQYLSRAHDPETRQIDPMSH
jgi:hypothetical protein